MRFKQGLLLLSAVVAGLILTACEEATISKIKNDPSHYNNRTVVVDGRVTNSFGAIVAGVYEIEDPTGKIFVISNGGVPSKGARVAVKGKVMNGVTLMGKNYGTAIRESDHKVLR